jgi:hypothetical protein
LLKEGMMTTDDLKAAERRVFRTAVDHGLWDVFLASMVAMLAIAPLLSETMGDFWSSAVFLPVYAGVYLAIRLIREHVVVPRVGLVQFGSYRKNRLRRFTVVMLTFNVVALVLGIIAAIAVQRGMGVPFIPIVFALIVLVGFSLAAYFLEIPRVFLYGVLLAVASLIGEWLFRRGYVSHHGYPVAAGVSAGVIAAIGLIKFALLIRRHGPVGDGPSPAARDG